MGVDRERHKDKTQLKVTLTKEGTRRQDRSDQRLFGGGDHVARGMVKGIGGWLTKETKPVLHGSDTRDGTGVITEKDTSKGREGDHEDAGELALGSIGTEARASCCGTTRHDDD